MLRAACLLALVASHCAAQELTPLAPPGRSDPPPPWHVSGLPHQRKPFTRFSVAEVEGQRGVRIDADRSYGNLLHVLPAVAAPAALSWRWRLDEPNPQADLRQRSAEDVPVRVCVLFDMPADRVPLGDRMMLRWLRSGSDDPVPTATVCYVWDDRLPQGAALRSPFTARLRMLVLRDHAAPLHDWLKESRDVGADFMRLFGDEADRVPPVIGVAIGADADNTQRRSLSYVAELKFGR